MNNRCVSQFSLPLSPAQQHKGRTEIGSTNSRRRGEGGGEVARGGGLQ